MGANRIRNVARLDDVDSVDQPESSMSGARASRKQCCEKNDRDAVSCHRPNYDSTKVCFAYFGVAAGEAPYEKKALVLRHSSFPLRHSSHARTGTLAVRSSLPQLTHAPLIARRIAFQMQ